MIYLNIHSLSLSLDLKVSDRWPSLDLVAQMADEANTEVTGPIRRVLLISAGASHSVALLCKFSFFLVRKGSSFLFDFSFLFGSSENSA